MEEKKESFALTSLFNMLITGSAATAAIAVSMIPYTTWDAMVLGGVSFSLTNAYGKALINGPYLGFSKSFERHFSDGRTVGYALVGAAGIYGLRHVFL